MKTKRLKQPSIIFSFVDINALFILHSMISLSIPAFIFVYNPTRNTHAVEQFVQDSGVEKRGRINVVSQLRIYTIWGVFLLA
jgi:hypothetical protein